LVFVWWLLTHIYYWPSAFLYSPPSVPVLILVLGCFLGEAPSRAATFMWVACLAVVTTNAVQILRVRDALQAMGGGP
jgi:hypothetical protein